MAVANLDPFAVQQVKGPYVKLPFHPGHCETEDDLFEYCRRRKEEGALLGADLFAGAGGLSEGLSQAGIEVVLGVDHYDYAVQTHAARFAGMTTSWDLATSENVERVANLMNHAGIEVLAGGPPCQPFSKAGRPGIRNLVAKGERDPIDERRNLWRAYLEVVQLARPRAVLMENVPDIALDNEMFIVRSMVTELEQIGYSVEGKVVDTWRYGVPQFRQRFILVAMRDGLKFTWPAESEQKVSVWNAIGDLPEVEGGARPDGGMHGWWPYEGPRTAFQKSMREGVNDGETDRVYDHITRPVRADDREAFEQMTSTTKYSDLPDHLRRYRSDIFNDKYKRLDENDLSRTITAHIAKDGYGFIHPRQHRTITVREAARLQTFPDDFRFAGPPSAAFKQIGNAVPVRLGAVVGKSIVESLQRSEKKDVNAHWIVDALASWYETQPASALTHPWLRSGDRWKIVVAETFLVRSSLNEAQFLWALIDQAAILAPGEKVPSEQIELFNGVFSGDRFEKRRHSFNKLCDEISNNPDALWQPRVDRAKLPTVNPGLVNLLELAAPLENSEGKSEEPVIVAKGILRITSRFLGEDTATRNKQSNGRISVGMILGLENGAREAHLALFEVARQICTSETPRCGACPLQPKCAFAGSRREDETAAVVPLFEA